MDRKGMLIVVSGFSGVGKGTVVRRMAARYDHYAISISATTRPPREGDREGVDYFFKTEEEFQELISKDLLIEYACYCGNYYGTPKAYVEEQMAKGRDVILEIEQQGGLKVKERYPDALMVFVMPPDVRTLIQRLRGRGTETEDMIRQRLEQAVRESEKMEQYEYMILNDDLEQSVEKLHHLIESQHDRIDRNLDFAEKIRKELKMTVKGE